MLDVIFLRRSARRKIVRLSSTHALAEQVPVVLSRIGEFFNRLTAIAEQLSPAAIWAIILSVVFRVWLRVYSSRL